MPQRSRRRKSRLCTSSPSKKSWVRSKRTKHISPMMICLLSSSRPKGSLRYNWSSPAPRSWRPPTIIAYVKPRQSRRETSGSEAWPSPLARKYKDAGVGQQAADAAALAAGQDIIQKKAAFLGAVVAQKKLVVNFNDAQKEHDARTKAQLPQQNPGPSAEEIANRSFESARAAVASRGVTGSVGGCCHIRCH